MNGVEISPVCPHCGDTWSMSIPHGKRTVRISCRRCGHQSDHTVATVMTDEGWLSTLAERERLRARTIRTLRIALWINAGAALFCVVVAFMTQTWGASFGRVDESDRARAWALNVEDGTKQGRQRCQRDRASMTASRRLFAR